MDDASTDGSTEVLRDAARQDARVRVIRLDQPSGAAIARNTAIAEARGGVIAFLDSDDLWSPDFLEKTIAFMRETKAAFVCSGYRMRSADLSADLGLVVPPATMTYRSLLRTCPIGCLTAAFDVSVVGKPTMPNVRRRQDYALWLHIAKRVGVVRGNPEVLATYRVRGDSISGNKRVAAAYQWQIYREVERLSLPSSLYYFVNYAVHGLIKHSSHIAQSQSPGTSE